jgi:hypothetical protein
VVSVSIFNLSPLGGNGWSVRLHGSGAPRNGWLGCPALGEHDISILPYEHKYQARKPVLTLETFGFAL